MRPTVGLCSQINIWHIKEFHKEIVEINYIPITNRTEKNREIRTLIAQEKFSFKQNDKCYLRRIKWEKY